LVSNDYTYLEFHPPEDAYGLQDKGLLHTVNKEVFGPDVKPKPGMVLGIGKVIK